jgi:FixJ family two-component response regulator
MVQERAVVFVIDGGRPNKQIAADLTLSETPVKVHREQVMRKMHAGSLPELVRMADRLGEPTATS